MSETNNRLLLRQLSNDGLIAIDEKYRNVVIEGVALDSRKVEEGFLFAALKGASVDGTKFIASAIESGAVAILCDNDFAGEIPENICLIKSDNPRKTFSQIASKFYNRQPDVIAAVTGTNGKTSVVHFCREIWKVLGKHAASVGTVGIEDSEGKVDFDRSNFLTTPDPVKLRKIISQLADSGVTHLAMEASSHGLDQYRPDGLNIKVAAFTNLTRDHLDYHGNFENYLAAKMRLFTEVMAPNGVAVLNADIEQFEQLETECQKRGLTVFSVGKYSRARRNYIDIFDILNTAEGQQISFEVLGRVYNINTSLIGEFQAYNMLCAMAVVVASGANVDEAAFALEKVDCVPGRMQRVTKPENDFSIFVDYSHTPDALQKALDVLKPLTKGKLWVVFGCGGDRDKGKRPLMGEIAVKIADNVVVTDDNPRSENPAQIRQEILASTKGAEEISDRHKAIEYAIAKLQKGDVLLIAGKGHEKTQTIGENVLPFDDVEVARKCIDN
ncbi:MAG: UDP-N-acetylmuramoyl-L-alanyl-D-glutamate--2,6-diaminopimelate ligase [Alphaproteobacteria bacterium CG11_big_fil_rev_8_21_14_0_20_39_49]|nr:MAG: UDP-N-acetylmuramoyl-L-alanyl-D-glutamate--2,6-diaminopimelate ligase [Alphaproteobacteria bacterium CG11_big_fil_rev_8_21_14_0_20_39_49]